MPVVAPPDEGAARRGAVGASTFSIELVAPGKLGLVFSPDTTLKPFTVEALAETGLALSHPQVQPGCTLVAVQDKLLHDKTYTVGLETIRGAGRPLTLTFERAPSDFSAEPTSVIGSAGDEHVDTPRDAPMPAALHRALGRGSPALNLTVEPVRAETPDHASAPATLSRALTRASEGPFGPATADIINWVLPLLGPAGVTLSERPANLGYPSGSTLFREQHPLKKRRYGTTKKGSLDKWKPLGGSGVKRFRLSPFSSQKVLTQRVGKVIRPGKLHDLKFYQYEVGKLGAKASRKDGQVLLYHVFLPDTASAASAAPPGNSSAAAALEELVPQLDDELKQFQPQFRLHSVSENCSENQPVAKPVEVLVDMLLGNEGLDEQGIFRLPGAISKVKQLIAALNAPCSNEADLEEFYPCNQTLASALKERINIRNSA